MRAATGAGPEDKDEAVRREARALAKTLFAKLDALSHFHFVPKPVIQEMAVRQEVPALQLEEIGTQVRIDCCRPGTPCNAVNTV